MPALSREMSALRICRDFQLVCSTRSRHTETALGVSRGRMRLKYQNRSIAIHHMTTQVAKIQSTIGPPSSRIECRALNGASSGSSSSGLPLQALGQQAGALLVENLHDALR